MTLIELLIVMGILLLLVTIGVTALPTQVETRRMREAARQVSVYFGSARARAMEINRPCGVMIERVTTEPRMAMVLHQVEVPPPYAGGDIGSKCIVQVDTNNSTPLVSATLQVRFSPPSGYTPTFPTSPIDYNLVLPGDLIQFNGQGPQYSIGQVDSGGATLRASIDLRKGQWIPWTSAWSQPMTYKILRQPQKSGAAPLQLPGTVVLDLEASGAESPAVMFGPSAASDTTPVTILFSGNGGLEGYYLSGTARPGIATLFLLLGKRQRVPATLAEDGRANFQDFDNYWIGISPQGLIATEQVSTAVGNTTGYPQDAFESRVLVRTGRSKGGG